jgi:dGTPase
MIRLLYEYYFETPSEIPETYLKTADKKIAVADYIAAMTDRYAVSKFESIFVPDSWRE